MTLHDDQDNPIDGAPRGAPWEEAPPGDWQEEMPEDLRKFFDNLEIGGQFTCNLQSFASPTYSGRPTELAQFQEYVPDLDTIAKHFGCGAFRFKFVWPSPTGTGNRNKNWPFQLAGSHYEEMAAQGMEERRNNRHSKMQEQAEQDAARLRAGIMPPPPPPPPPPPDPLESMGKAINSMGPLFALIKGGPQPVAGSDASMLPIMIQMMQMQANQQMENSKNTMQMMMEQSKNSMALVLGLLGQKNNQPVQESADNMFFKALGAVKEMVNMQKMLSPPEETNTDKVLQFIAGIGEPIIKALIAKSPQQIAKDPMVVMARSLPIVEAIRQNESDQVELVNHFDEKFGNPATTDAIITALGFSRPAECKAAETVQAAEAAEPSSGTDI